MYQFSRAIYRELAPQILAPPTRLARAAATTPPCCAPARRSITRLATDRHYFARPARTLFCDIRSYFPMSAQARRPPRRHPLHRLAQQFLAEHPHEGYTAVSGAPPQCRATTRKGSACQRTPLPHNGYCPSHQHLADTEDRELAAA